MILKLWNMILKSFLEKYLRNFWFPSILSPTKQSWTISTVVYFNSRLLFVPLAAVIVRLSKTTVDCWKQQSTVGFPEYAPDSESTKLKCKFCFFLEQKIYNQFYSWIPFIIKLFYFAVTYFNAVRIYLNYSSFYNRRFLFFILSTD